MEPAFGGVWDKTVLDSRVRWRRRSLYQTHHAPGDDSRLPLVIMAAP